jgi:hypothetical protein
MDDALHEIRGTFGQIATDERIGDDEKGSGHHHVLVFEAKQCV